MAAEPLAEPGEARDVQARHVDQVLETLFSYVRDPFIDDFLREHGIPVYFDLNKLHALLPRVLLGADEHYRIPLPDLVAYLDRLQETGRQHVFLFRLPREDRGTRLERLRNPEYLRRQLVEHKLCGALGRPLWETDKPELVKAERNDSRLVLQFVESRAWHENVVRIEDARKIRVEEPRRERAVTFIVFDLDTGASEIRLQKRRPNTETSLRDELEDILARMREILGFDPFVPVDLEPAIRNALELTWLPVTRLAVALPDGGYVRGKVGADLFRELRLKLPAFTATSLEYDVPVNQGRRRVRVKLDGRTGAIEICHPSLPAEHARILRQVRRWSGGRIVDHDLRELAKKHEELGTVLKKVDLHVSDLGERKVDSRRLTGSEWLPTELVLQAFDRIAGRENRFGVDYFYEDPRTHRSMRVTSRSQAPEDSDVWAVLKLLGEPDRRPVGLLLKLLAKSRVRVGVVLEKVLIALFTLAYLPVAYFTAGRYLELVADYPDVPHLTHSLFVVVLVALVTVYVAVVGWERVRKSWSLVSEILQVVTEEVNEILGWVVRRVARWWRRPEPSTPGP